MTARAGGILSDAAQMTMAEKRIFRQHHDAPVPCGRGAWPGAGRVRAVCRGHEKRNAPQRECSCQSGQGQRSGGPLRPVRA
ncbi:hypothetical protein DESPIG_00426 [Desulfovibrio piger ATCC 29098]|uniref:Uncharacterized protein n=1 Tax=Desulfovibrio piger ATCC 29098 TaxID=411464 RepID=B6WQU7_9BACT|nr:hypothetical protein DESPIG_00426 [Desulfovibrio piger ATCC 29098]